jgi:hypothetical protein
MPPLCLYAALWPRLADVNFWDATNLASPTTACKVGAFFFLLIPACRSLNVDVDRGVKRCRGVGKAGAVSMFKRYFSAQLGSTPCSSKTVNRYFPKVPRPGRVK